MTTTANVTFTEHEIDVLAQFVQDKATPRSILNRGLRRDDTLDPADAEVLALVSVKLKLAQYDARCPQVKVPNHACNPFPAGRHSTGWA